jgi:hypothetical protein
MELEDCRLVTRNGDWKAEAQRLLNGPKPSATRSNKFSIHWIEAGHRIREQISNDRVLVDLLRHMLPPYQGKDMTLFRGENLDRWFSKELGLAWTSQLHIAEMFASGLNAVDSGGVLLEGQFKREAIICGPNTHSAYLGENQFTVDPFIGGEIVVLNKFSTI